MKKLFLLLLALPLLATAKASDSTARMDAFFTDIASFSADFSQVTVASDGAPVASSSGHMSLQRPGRFNWDYQLPHQQRIVSDGLKVWMYDPDLEQVTVRPLEDIVDGTPAALISGGRPGDQFQVSEMQDAEGDWVVLKPYSRDSDFLRIRLQFQGQNLSRMQLLDQFEQTTDLRFSAMQLNPKIAAAKFQFSPPAGVEVVGDDL